MVYDCLQFVIGLKLSEGKRGFGPDDGQAAQNSPKVRQCLFVKDTQELSLLIFGQL